jgi:periplasmic protein TonB
MFEATIDSSWDERSRRGLTALTSFGLQALAVCVLLVLPLLRPAGLPLFHSLSTPVSLGRLGEPPAVRSHAGATTAVARSNPADITLRMPTQIPHGIPTTNDEGPPQVAESGPGIFGTTGGGDPHGVPNLFGAGTRPVLPVAAPPVVALVRLSHMSEGDLIRKVQPAYPALARSAGIHGAVVLSAMISKQGVIENLRVLTGHPMLVPAAIEAVRQWRYRPYVLNNEPVEVETQITVNFSLAGN